MSPLCTRMVLTHLKVCPPKGQSQLCPPKREGPPGCDTECINKPAFVGIKRNSKQQLLMNPAFYFPSPALCFILIWREHEGFVPHSSPHGGDPASWAGGPSPQAGHHLPRLFPPLHRGRAGMQQCQAPSSLRQAFPIPRAPRWAPCSPRPPAGPGGSQGARASIPPTPKFTLNHKLIS